MIPIVGLDEAVEALAEAPRLRVWIIPLFGGKIRVTAGEAGKPFGWLDVTPDVRAEMEGGASPREAIETVASWLAEEIEGASE